MKNDEINKSLNSELNDNSKEFYDNITNDSPIINSENNLNSNYEEKYSEFGENKISSNVSEAKSLTVEDIEGASAASTVSVSTAASIATTALVAIVGGITILTTTVTTKVEIEIESIVASYNYIDYRINAIGDTESVILNITNGFDVYEVSLTEGINIGQAPNLKSNMDYTITITYDDFLTRNTAYKGTITTLSTKEYITDPNTFNLIYNCQCGVDGYFYFYMDFRDDYQYWTNFSATLEDNYGNVSACVFTSDLYDLQKIAIVNYDGKLNDLIGEEAKLKITCDTKESNEKLVLYDKIVEI